MNEHGEYLELVVEHVPPGGVRPYYAGGPEIFPPAVRAAARRQHECGKVFRMALQIALLRAVNVGGRTIRMAELRALFAELGFTDTRTLLQSGNVVFNAGTRTGPALEAFLEAETEQQLKLRAEYFVRTAAQWKKAIAQNPFARQAKKDPSHLLLMPMKSAPKKHELAALEAVIRGRERVQAVGGQLYAVYPDGIGRSKLTTQVIERALGTRCTGRNWNTVLKLDALLQP